MTTTHPLFSGELSRAVRKGSPEKEEGLAPLRLGWWWRDICATELLIPGRGVAARVAGQQVAIFLLASGELAAIDDRDPFSGAMVLSRGIVGEVDGVPTIVSPLYKQRFNLRTGCCLDDEGVQLHVWLARVRGGRIEVAVP